ncbi:MAG: HigA family addiction module antidote protein [Thermoanaerobaculia bacterium]|nr:HigA family addiction module antidote protein [Thermoanaerobaculia bacterium]
MLEKTRNEYQPDTVSPPGETLQETLLALGMSQAQLAERMGRPKKTISELVNGKIALTTDTALQLERVLGVPARFWNNRERLYRESLARNSEQARLEAEIGWLGKFPVKAMIKLGWIPAFKDKVGQLRSVLGFFGVASPAQWETTWRGLPEVSFRKTQAFQSDAGALSAWLRQGEILAQEIRASPFDPASFRAALHKVRTLTIQPPEVFQPQIVSLCASAGVAVVFVPELPQSRVSGATRWLAPGKALIQLSLRYKTDDHLWFTFFHEAGHILLHGKREVFLEGIGDTDGQEAEANRFAADFLIPAQRLEQLIAGNKSRGVARFSKETIRSFAAELGIAPGIVVGRLQHERLLPRSHCNELKNRLAWALQQDPNQG